MSDDVDFNDIEVAVRRFYGRYTACLDNGRYSDWPSFFTDDASYDVISKENFDQGLPLGAMWCRGVGMIRDRVVAIKDVLWREPRTLRRFLGEVLIRSVDGPVIESEANFLIVESMLDRAPQINMCGRYVDTLIRGADGGLLIKQRACVYDNDHLRTSLSAPV